MNSVKNFKFNTHPFLGDYIHGQFLKVEKVDGSFKDISPADLSDELLTVNYKLDHVDMAIDSAQKAYGSWAILSLDERKKYLIGIIINKICNCSVSVLPFPTGRTPLRTFDRSLWHF